MANTRLPNWVQYWSKFKDLKLLQLKSLNLDDTLHDIETEFDCKLTSGDHFMIIDALEDRIEQLKSSASAGKPDNQTDLFD